MANDVYLILKNKLDFMDEQQLRSFATGLFAIATLCKNPFEASDELLNGTCQYTPNPQYIADIKYAAKIMLEMGDEVMILLAKLN